MPPGPVFYVEMVAVARRARYYWLRLLYCSALLFFLWTTYTSAYSWRQVQGREGFTIAELSQFGLSMFATIATVQAVAVALLTPALVAGVISDERERKTLHYLMASSLSSAEIVLGKLLARLLVVGVILALGLPVASLLTLFGGVDPVIVALTYLGTFTLAFFLASLSVLVSVYAAKPRSAIVKTYLILMFWVILPYFVLMVLLWLSGWSGNNLTFASQLDEWLNPLGMSGLFSPLAMGRGSSVVPVLLWRFALQVIWGLVFAGWATLRLRPVFRKSSDKVVRSEKKGVRRVIRRIGIRLWPKPACGNDPMIWKEVFFIRGNVAGRVLVLLAAGPILLIVAYWYVYLGWRAAGELLINGYAPSVPSYQIFSARQGFAEFARATITGGYVFCLLGICAAGATSLTSERERDTWVSLTASPLTSWEIIRGKMLGALASIRWLVIGMLFILLSSLFLGGHHPLGALFWLIEAAVFFWFAIALATFFSMRAKNSTRALAQTIGFMIIINGGYLFCCFPLMRFSDPSPIVTAFFTPLIQYFAQFSVSEWSGNGYGFPPTEAASFLAASVIGVVALGIAAYSLTRLMVAQLDTYIDRPRRGDITFGPETEGYVKKQEAPLVIEYDDDGMLEA